MSAPPRFWIEPAPGFAPTIGRLVCMLGLVRERTLSAVEGLSTAALDHQHDATSNGVFLVSPTGHVTEHVPIIR